MTCKKLLGVVCGLQHIWIVLTFVVSGYTAYDNDPRFLGSLKNVTVIQGKDASLTCMVENLGDLRIGWVKDTGVIQAINDYVITHNARVSVVMNWLPGYQVTSTLHIKAVQREDKGFYICQITTDPMEKQKAYLKVVIPPDITSEETSNDLMVPEGGTAKLICRATGYPKPTITWKKEDGNYFIIKEHQGRNRKVKSYEGEVLSLTKITRSEMGAYLCIASNGVPPSISKRIFLSVHFHPLIQVPNPLVASPRGIDILLECSVEASPKAINYWTRETGERIIANDKFNMSEETQSHYGVKMRLQLRNLTCPDFSGYKCISQNSMGATAGTIHIHEINLSAAERGVIDKVIPISDGEQVDDDCEESTGSPLVEGHFHPVDSSLPSKGEKSQRIIELLIPFLVLFSTHSILPLLSSVSYFIRMVWTSVCL